MDSKWEPADRPPVSILDSMDGLSRSPTPRGKVGCRLGPAAVRVDDPYADPPQAPARAGLSPGGSIVTRPSFIHRVAGMCEKL